MDIVTAWGVRWRVASSFEFLIVFIVLVFVILFLFLLKYSHTLSHKSVHENQLLLFKTRQLGLTNYQVKIIQGITRILKLKDPPIIIENASLFEHSIAAFLMYVSSKGEKHESLVSICRDIVITYEKVYHHIDFREPIKLASQIGEQQLLYFTLENRNVYIGKIINTTENELVVQIFINAKEIKDIKPDLPVKTFFWRSGDAEYTFESSISSIENNIVKIKFPEKLNRGKETHAPFVDLTLHCLITATNDNDVQVYKKSIEGTIYKLNEYECILRAHEKLDFKHNHLLTFHIEDFNVVVHAKIISERTIKERHITYYTFKFNNISKAAHDIIKTFIIEHL